MTEKKIRCRILTGPTCSGKSRLGLRLAEENGWVIACMDSMQIYRGMDIGTAKPSREEQARVDHCLFDICDPRDAFSAALWRDQAESLIRRKWAEGREVLFVGGTGLYLDALIHPMDLGSTPADPEIREKLRKTAEEDGGRERLHAMLASVDPETAERLPINDVRRIIRAIEVYKITGIPFSRQPKRQMDDSFEWMIAATRVQRDSLYEHINQRTGKMMDAGLEEEVRRLLQEGVPENAQSMQGIGYKEMIPVIQGLCSIEEAAEQIRLHTRHYAKRQQTYLRRVERIQYIDAEREDAWQRLNEMMAG